MEKLKEALIPKGPIFKGGKSSKEISPADETGGRKLVKRKTAGAKMEKYIAGLADTVEGSGKDGSEQLAGCLRVSGPFIAGFMRFLALIVPIYINLYTKAYYYYSKLPKNVMSMIFGATLCFFGGTFVASLAAVEAARTMGLERMLENLGVVMKEMKVIKEAHEEDEQRDDDGDGVADVDDLPPHELIKHKTVVAMEAVKDPAKLQGAVGGLWAAYLAVLATLKLQFARTTALALGIAEMVEFPVMRVCAPPLKLALGDKLAHWTETIVDSAIKLVAIIFAWYVQMVIAAFNSGLRGGRIFADALFSLALERGWMEKLPEWMAKQPYDPDNSYLDEVVMYTLAAGGIAFQLGFGFTLPFPLNLILFPLQIIEWILKVQIAW